MRGCYAVCHKQLGDVVLLEPAFRKLRRLFGSVEVLTRTGHKPLLDLMPGVRVAQRFPFAFRDAAVAYDSDRKSAVRSIPLPALNRTLILRDAAEIRGIHRVIFGRIIAPGLGDRYVSEYVWSLTPGEDAAFKPPRLERPPESWRPERVPHDYLLIHPTTGWKRKNWRNGGWIAVARAFPNATIVITGGSEPWQRDKCRFIASALGSRAIDLAGLTSLNGYLWICAHARCIITVDGSASHFAAAFGVPSLTLFGPTSPANWHWPAPQQLIIEAEADPEGDRQVRSITADAVVEATRSLL